MTQRLRVCTALPEDQSLGPSINVRQLTASCNPALGNPIPFSGFLGHVHLCAYTCKIKPLKIKFCDYHNSRKTLVHEGHLIWKENLHCPLQQVGEADGVKSTVNLAKEHPLVSGVSSPLYYLLSSSVPQETKRQIIIDQRACS